MINLQRLRCAILVYILVIAIFLLNGCEKERNLFNFHEIDVSYFVVWEVSQIDPDAMLAYFQKYQTRDGNIRVRRGRDEDKWVIEYPVLEFGQIVARVSICVYDEECQWESGEGYIAHYDDTWKAAPLIYEPEPALKEAGVDDHFFCEFLWYGKHITIDYGSLVAADYKERMERVLHDLAKCQDYTDAAVN